jgi:hypothetical protein
MPNSGYPFAAKVGQFKPPNWANSEYRNQKSAGDMGVEVRQLGVEVAAARKYIGAFQGRDFHLPHASHFLKYSARATSTSHVFSIG